MVKIIYIVGPPAAGKTAVSQLLASFLGTGSVRQISIDDGYHALCPNEITSTRYRYEADGSLLLIDRQNLLHESLLWMRNKINHLRVDPDTALILAEFYYADYQWAFSQLHDHVWGPVWVIEVHAPWHERLRRNSKRPHTDRVPDEYMETTRVPTSFQLNMVHPMRHHVMLVNDQALDDNKLVEHLRSLANEILRKA